jgi:hypothetical protein
VVFPCERVESPAEDDSTFELVRPAEEVRPGGALGPDFDEGRVVSTPSRDRPAATAGADDSRGGGAGAGMGAAAGGGAGLGGAVARAVLALGPDDGGSRSTSS